LVGRSIFLPGSPACYGGGVWADFSTTLEEDGGGSASVIWNDNEPRAVSGSGEVYGAYLTNFASFSYNGTLSSEATGIGSETAFGMYANNTGPLTVNGSVSAFADAGATASATGILANNTGNINNAAAITVTADGEDAYAAGLLVMNPVGNIVVNNTGDIEAEADGFLADAYGIQAEGAFIITNSATISADADAVLRPGLGHGHLRQRRLFPGQRRRYHCQCLLRRSDLAQAFGINAADMIMVTNHAEGTIAASADGAGWHGLRHRRRQRCIYQQLRIRVRQRHRLRGWSHGYRREQHNRHLQQRNRFRHCLGFERYGLRHRGRNHQVPSKTLAKSMPTRKGIIQPWPLASRPSTSSATQWLTPAISRSRPIP
jgi:hypothetical protein